MRKAIAIALLALIMALPLFAAGSRESAAERTYILRYGHVQPATDPFNVAYEKWARTVTERTGGRLTVQVFPSAQLGVEEDVLEQMREGSNVGWQTDPARLGNYVKDWSVLYAPYLLNGMEDIQKLLNSPTIAEWTARLEREHGIRVLSYAWVQGFRNIFANKMGRSPAELSGVMIRTAPAPAWLATVNSLGATAVGLPYGELYNAIQTGVVDGAELPYAAARALNVQEVARYIVETQHIYQMNTVVVSAAWFNSLPEEFQKILVDEANKAGIEVSNQLAQAAAANRQFFVDQGMTLIPFNDLDIAAFRASGQQAYRALGLEAARDRIYRELGR